MTNQAKANRQNILFTGVLGPYGVDSQRTRFKNPMNLLANQVTRGQKYYTVQMNNATWAFDLFGANLAANVATLNFPSEKQLSAVLQSGQWDRVGISSIIPNFESLLATYQLIRRIAPRVPIDIGGHIANDEAVLQELVERMRKISATDRFRVWLPDMERKALRPTSVGLNAWLGANQLAGEDVTFVKRDGLEYYSRLEGVGLKDDGVVHAPLVDASFDKKVFGIPVPATSAGLLLPDVGCPMKCNFCSTSHKFNGRFVQFLRTAEDIMAVANAHADRGKTELFVMSENFSLDTRRALKLLDLMEQQRRPHRYAVFSSANALVKLGVENIVKLGYSFIWIGLEESTGQTYKKMHGADLKQLVSQLQSYGVEILGSTILGFEHQTMGCLDREVAHALTYECVYNQFMLYMPIPGTAFWEEMKSAGKLKKNFEWPETHGQSVQNWNHPRIGDQQLEARLDRAFEEDFEVLGPSLYRMMKVHYNGFVNTRDWNHELVQMRRESTRNMFFAYIPILHAMHRDLRSTGHRVADGVRDLRDAMIGELGLKGRVAAALGGPVVHAALKLEKMRDAAVRRKRRQSDPRCLLTHYGSFEHRYPSCVPRPESARESVAIARAAACGAERTDDAFEQPEAMVSGSRA